MIHKITHRLRRHKISFGHAFEGFYYALSSQPNFVVHCVIASIALILGLFLNISLSEWLVVLVMITVVMSFELINTGIETTIDLVTLDFHPLAKKAKDVSSAAVLIVATGAFVIGILIFLPKIFALL